MFQDITQNTTRPVTLLCKQGDRKFTRVYHGSRKLAIALENKNSSNKDLQFTLKRNRAEVDANYGT